MNNISLMRVQHDRMFLGVAGGLANYLGWDATWVRLGLVAAALLTQLFPVLLVYAVLAFVLPAEGDEVIAKAYPLEEGEIIIHD